MRTLTCIICPRGCTLTVDENLSVTGNSCKRGETYAIDECIRPTRTVTSIIRVENRKGCMLSVKTAAPIPKGDMQAAMQCIRSAVVSAPIALGDVVLEDFYGTQLIATKTVR